MMRMDAIGVAIALAEHTHTHERGGRPEKRSSVHAEEFLPARLFCQPEVRYHAFKSGSCHGSSGRLSQILIYYFDLTPPQLLQSQFHRILQLLALQVVHHLVGRRLANIKNGLALQMLGADLLTHRPPPVVRRCTETASIDARSASGPTGGPFSDVFPLAPAAVLSGGGTARLDGIWIVIVCASASPELLERCCASIVADSTETDSVFNRSFNTNKAALLT